jgi:hypothetical protein
VPLDYDFKKIVFHVKDNTEEICCFGYYVGDCIDGHFRPADTLEDIRKDDVDYWMYLPDLPVDNDM